jgi:DNA replication protein DnaC
MTPLRIEAYWAELWNRPMPKLCPACGGLGYVKVADVLPEDPQFGKIEHCQICNTDRRMQWLADNCGLEPNELDKAYTSQYRQGDWSELESEVRNTYQAQRIAVSKALVEARQNRAGLLTFYGDYGSGKTFALQIAVNEARADLAESFYAPFSLILAHLRQLVARRQDNSNFLTRLFDIPVLAIDEVTRFNDTGWAMEQLFVLVDTRYRRRSSHLTLFATNDDPRQMLDTGESIGYLMSRCRQGKLFELRGDMR